MLTVPKLPQHAQLNKNQIPQVSVWQNLPQPTRSSGNALSQRMTIKHPILLHNSIKEKQNVPTKKKDTQIIQHQTNGNEQYLRMKTEHFQRSTEIKFLPQKTKIQLKNQHSERINKTQRPFKECFSPKYMKQREENQKILQSLKLENQKYKKLIQQNEFLRKKQNFHEVAQFTLFSQNNQIDQTLPKMKKTPVKQIIQPKRRALEEMTNLTTSFVIDESADFFNCQKQNKFNIPNKKLKTSFSLKVSDFAKLKFLGKGNFGQVNLVIHKKTNFICAMKTIKKSFVKEEKVVHQISRQIRIHLSLKHLNIIGFYGFFDDSENVYLLIEYATGGQLYKRLKQTYRMPEKQVIPIIKDALDGLKMIHSLRYIHRDLKPENMIFQFGIGKICDLGWAADCGLNEMRKSYCGTPLYLPPEMIRKQTYDQSADIWSIGILTYQLLVGKIPFNIWSEYDLQQIVDREINFPTDYVDMSKESIDFIKKCLMKNPAQRIKLEQLSSHPFLNNSSIDGYFNVEVYDAVEKLFE